MAAVASDVGEIQSLYTCRTCTRPFVSRYKGQVTCGTEACRANDPDRVARDRLRNRKWHQEHRGTTGRSIWLLGAPPHSAYLPGGGCVISVDPHPKFALELPLSRLLHGVMSNAINEPHGEDMGTQQAPGFSLVPWKCPFGWAVYFRTEKGCALANRTIDARLFDKPVRMTFGPLARMKAPVVERRGRQRVVLETVTPVAIGHTNNPSNHVHPTSGTLIASLNRGFPKRLGLRHHDDSSIALEIIEQETQPAYVDLNLHPERGGYGRTVGWTGRVVLEVNAVARWLLEAAARGPGLGGRVAFGFGAIRVHGC